MQIDLTNLDAIFLDAGNTLVSMDFAFLCELLAPLGVTTTPAALARAEAAARPAVSRWVAGGAPSDVADWMVAYVRQVLGPLVGEPARDDVARDLVAAVRRRVTTDRLWSFVLPGVPEALAALQDAGLTLVVVSNSDGTAERGLVRAGLRGHLLAVVDSAVVGVEKPDPRIFRHALELAGVRPERTVHVGDLYHVDVQGSRAAGVEGVLLDPYDDWTDVDCDRVPDVATLARRIVAARG